MVKYNPQGVTDAFMDEVKQHFTDAEICEIGYILLAYGGAHNFLSSIGERVVDDHGNPITPEDGYQIVFNTHSGFSALMPAELASLNAPLPQEVGWKADI